MSDYGSRGYGNNGPDDYGRPGPNSGDRGGYGGYAGRGDGYGGSYNPGSAGRSSDSASVGRGPSPHDEPLTSGRARVPSGESTGPGRARGSARVGGKPASGRSEEDSEVLRKAKKKKRRRRRYIALGCVLVMMIGIGTVAGSIFFEQVPVPDEIYKELNQSTSIRYAGGEQMAKVGIEDRKVLKDKQIPKFIKDELVSAEDQKYWEHGGVDFWGVMRAVYNNFTGGDTQGASTLEQQYVGAVAKIRDDHSYFRKANEAVMAMKLGDAKTKKEILVDYLNLMPFGRGTFGIGAAAKTFFGHDDIQDLTKSEGALLIAQLKASGGTYDPRDPLGLGKDTVKENAETRWSYVLDSMVKTHHMKQSDRDKITKLPKTEPIGSQGADTGAAKDTGFVSHNYALAEAADRVGLDVDAFKTKGYTITTTIDKGLQDAAVAVADSEKGSAMAKKKGNLRAGLVSVDPKTGGVRSYYGGSDGTGTDKAGYGNMHPPGSSFKEFTMITALEKDISLQSQWDGSSPRKFQDRKTKVVNSDGEEQKPISMEDAVVKSLNTPIYAITSKVGANNVLKTARDMGITKIKDPETGKIKDLSDKKITEKLDGNEKRSVVDNEIGFGQYPVSVKDMASANATMADDGRARPAHFVKQVKDADGKVVFDDSELQDDAKSVVKPGAAHDATKVAAQIQPMAMKNAGNGNKLTNGQPSAGKTGTWEKQCDTCNDNSAVWYAGYTPQLSAAVWVGDKENENGEVLDETGQPAYGAGPSGDVWTDFMNRAMKIMKVEGDKIQQFKPADNVGDPGAGELGAGKDTGTGDDEGGEQGGDEGGDNGDDNGDDDTTCDPATGKNCKPGAEDGYCPTPPDTTDPDCDDGGDDGGSCDPFDPSCDATGRPYGERTSYYGENSTHQGGEVSESQMPWNQPAIREDYTYAT